ncbi:MAG: hypothetical protein GHCLOJNM_03315 [bacterium]|nr:hypothetical protein [bacterium]
MRNLREFIKHCIDTPLKDPTFILPDSDGWIDAIDKTIPSPHEGSHAPPSGSTRDEYVHRRLGHIAVNPHNSENTEALVASYTFPDDLDLPSVYINRSHEGVRLAVQQLVLMALRERDFIYGTDPLDRTGRKLAAAGHDLVVLHGERGSGKTFFLNYVLSHFSHYFDSEKVIWVRLNLVEDFGNNDYLLHRIYAQATKIIMRYYDPQSDQYQQKPIPLSVSTHLYSWIEANKPNRDEASVLNQKVMGMCQVFHHKTRDERVTPNLVPMVLGRRSFEYAQESGYSFIIVLDGLDQLDATPFHKRKFENLLQSTDNLARDQAALGMVFLVVTRTNTLRSLPNANISPYINSAIIEWRLKEIPLDSILHVRTSFLKSNVARLSTQQNWDTSDWPQHIDEFVNFVSQEIRGTRFPASFGANSRAQMQIVQLMYFDFLDIQHERPYLLIESVAKAGLRYPPKHYSYCIPPGRREWERRVGTHTQLDNHLLPFIFSYPVLDYYSHTDPSILLPPHSAGVLLGLRVLQIVAAQEHLLKQSPVCDRLRLHELTEMCKRLFDYPKFLTTLLLEEFVEYELLSLAGNEGLRVSNTTISPLYAMPKLFHMLDRFMYNLAYLNLCAMRVPFSIRAFSKEPSFVRSGTLDSVRYTSLRHESQMEREEKLFQWVTTKILNSIALYRLLNRINTTQKTMFEERRRGLNERLQRIALNASTGLEGTMCGIFEFPRVMRDELLVQLNAIVEQLGYSRPDRIERLKEALNDYWRSWGEGGR